MADFNPWERYFDPRGVCKACGRQRDCLVRLQDGPLCFACGWEYIDPLFMGQYLIWKELRAVRTFLGHPWVTTEESA